MIRTATYEDGVGLPPMAVAWRRTRVAFSVLVAAVHI